MSCTGVVPDRMSGRASLQFGGQCHFTGTYRRGLVIRLGRHKRLFCIMEGYYLKPEKSHRLGFQK